MAAPSMSAVVALAALGFLGFSSCADAETQQVLDANGDVVSTATPDALPLAGSTSPGATAQPEASIKGYDSLYPHPPPEPAWQRVLNTIVQSGGAAR